LPRAPVRDMAAPRTIDAMRELHAARCAARLK
jgi:hypothetical protein